VTREQQIAAALRILAPTTERELCRVQITEALDIIEKADKSHRLSTPAHSKATAKAWRSYNAALRRLKAARAELDRAGWQGPDPGLFLKADYIEDALAYTDPDLEPWKYDFDRPRETKAHSAARLARWLLDRWGVGTSVARNSPWSRLAAALYGDPKADLFRQMRTVRRRALVRPAKTLLSN
jgi:hypothetical protein